MNYGYARASTIAQNLDRQFNESLKLGLDQNRFIPTKNLKKTLIEKITKS